MCGLFCVLYRLSWQSVSCIEAESVWCSQLVNWLVNHRWYRVSRAFKVRGSSHTPSMVGWWVYRLDSANRWLPKGITGSHIDVRLMGYCKPSRNFSHMQIVQIISAIRQKYWRWKPMAIRARWRFKWFGFLNPNPKAYSLACLVSLVWIGLKRPPAWHGCLVLKNK